MMLFLSLLIVAAESKHCLHRVPARAPTFILLSDNLLVVLIQNCLGGKQFLTEQDYRFNVSSSRIKQRDSPALLLSMWRMYVRSSAANRLIGEVVQSRRRPLLGPSPG